MKILLLCRRYTGLDGHSTVINNVAYSLLKNGMEPTIGAFNFIQDPPSKIPKLILNWKKDLFQFNKTVKDFDLIHNFQTLTNYVALLTNKPFIFHYLGIGTSLQGINMKFTKIITKKSIDKYFVSSSVSAKELFALIHVNSEIIPLSVDPYFFSTSSELILKKGDPQLLTVTRMMPYKKNEELLYGFKKLLEFLPESHLRIIGTGPQLEDLQNMIKKLELSSHVELLGQVKHSNMLSYYTSCDVYVSTSSKEAFPLPVIECMAVGKPVVLSDIQIHGEIINESKAGECYESGNLKDLANKINMILKDTKTYSYNAKVYAQQWNLDNLGKRLIQIYTELIKNQD